MMCEGYKIIVFIVTSFKFFGHASFIDNQVFHRVFSCVSTDDFYDSTIETGIVDSVVKCSVLCSRRLECAAFQISRLAPFTCILHSRTLQSQSCLEYPDTDLRGYNNVNARCLNGGWKQGNVCQCFHGYMGSQCERIQTDCNEGQESDQYSLGTRVSIVHPQGAPSPFLVLCQLTSFGGKTFLMKRNAGDVDFNRPWADYKSGFGDVSREHWIGLDNIHYLTHTNNQKLAVTLTTRLPDDTYPYRQRFYFGFLVANETGGYAFTVDSTWAHSDHRLLGDCLTAMEGKRFTTVDVDNDDLGGENCALLHQGGWWFTGCGDCNPTGPMVIPTSGTLLGIPNEVFWFPGIPTYCKPPVVAHKGKIKPNMGNN